MISAGAQRGGQFVPIIDAAVHQQDQALFSILQRLFLVNRFGCRMERVISKGYRLAAPFATSVDATMGYRAMHPLENSALYRSAIAVIDCCDSPHSGYAPPSLVVIAPLALVLCTHGGLNLNAARTLACTIRWCLLRLEDSSPLLLVRGELDAFLWLQRESRRCAAEQGRIAIQLEIANQHAACVFKP
jgi:hypothetical protein